MKRRRARASSAPLVFASVLLAFGTAWAQNAWPNDSGYFPVDLHVGESFDMCKSGEIVCPARGAICDDPKVVVPVDLPGGIGFQGVSPGATLCSAASAIGPRRVFRITVR